VWIAAFEHPAKRICLKFFIQLEISVGFLKEEEKIPWAQKGTR
jgi:hypothetical protein